jgi:hypothetical protein
MGRREATSLRAGAFVRDLGFAAFAYTSHPLHNRSSPFCAHGTISGAVSIPNGCVKVYQLPPLSQTNGSDSRLQVYSTEYGVLWRNLMWCFLSSTFAFCRNLCAINCRKQCNVETVASYVCTNTLPVSIEIIEMWKCGTGCIVTVNGTVLV